MTIVTISRQMCSLGSEIAETLSRKTGWEIITKDNLLSDIFVKTANKHELHMLSESPKFYHSQTSENISFIEFLKQELYEMAETKSAILVGFGSHLLFTGHKDVIRLRITAPQEIRIERLKKRFNINGAEAVTILKNSDRKQNRFVSTVYDNISLNDTSYYDMILNTTTLSVDEYVSSIITLIKEHETRRELELQTENTQVRNNQTSRTSFKNPEEIEFAQILDTYHIEWIYEPKTFPIEWDSDGNVTLAFSPDFYLPKFDLYLELTIMNQKYVTLKNRKAKKLREIYPGINVRIVYKKDFQSLVERFSEFNG
ncbi:MAG: cytidylate kinase family protein [Saccharofermentanales bacterium]